MLYQLQRTAEEIKADSPCIGTCALNERNICIGCERHIDEIICTGKPVKQKYTQREWDRCVGYGEVPYEYMLRAVCPECRTELGENDWCPQCNVRR